MSIDGKVATLALQADECEVQMKGLKVVLYAKFGKAINLDEWKPEKSPSFEMEKTLNAWKACRQLDVQIATPPKPSSSNPNGHNIAAVVPTSFGVTV